MPDACKKCGTETTVSKYCDTDGGPYCPECYATTPCGQEEHGECGFTCFDGSSEDSDITERLRSIVRGTGGLDEAEEAALLSDALDEITRLRAEVASRVEAEIKARAGRKASWDEAQRLQNVGINISAENIALRSEVDGLREAITAWDRAMKDLWHSEGEEDPFALVYVRLSNLGHAEVLKSVGIEMPA